MAFRKVSYNCLTRLNQLGKVGGHFIDQRVTTEEKTDRGTVLIRSRLEKVPVEEISAKLAEITPSEYRLQNLIKAGVDLQRVNVNGLLDSTDPIEVDAQNEVVVDSTFEKLLDHEYSVSEKKKASVKVENNDVIEKSE